jgi:predicted sulfurtransferase
MRTVRPTAAALTLAALVIAGTTAVAQWRDDDASVPRISLTDLQKLMSQDEVLVIDVRDGREYQLGHIPGAVSIPLGTEQLAIQDLRRVTKQIVTYCT